MLILTSPRWRTAAILKKNRKIAISQERFDRLPRHLAQWHLLLTAVRSWGAHLLSLGHLDRWWIMDGYTMHGVSDAWPVRRQTYGYLPSRKTLPLPWLVLISRLTQGTRLSRPESRVTYQDGYPQTVTHPSTNRARRRVTSVMWPTTLPINQTATLPD